MGTNDHVILTIAGLIRDATVMNAAVLAGDLSDAREHALEILAKADESELFNVARAAAYVLDSLGDGDSPLPGCGARILELAHELDAAMVASLE